MDMTKHSKNMGSLVRIAGRHGIDADIEGDAVIVRIPYCKDGKHAGYFHERVSTISELRDALGY